MSNLWETPKQFASCTGLLFVGIYVDLKGNLNVLLMKQLDIVVSPPAFVWDPYMTLTHVTLDLDICDLEPQTVPVI